MKFKYGYYIKFIYINKKNEIYLFIYINKYVRMFKTIFL